MGDRPCRPLLTNQMSESSRFAKHSLLNKVLDWARHEEPIRAVVLTGSLARGDGSTDQWSDLDAQIIATEFLSYIADDTWLDTLGEVWIRFPLYQDVPYRLVWFAGGVKVDFQFVSVDAIHDMIRSGALSDEYLRGYVVALDKDDLFREIFRLRRMSSRSPIRPARSKFKPSSTNSISKRSTWRSSSAAVNFGWSSSATGP